MTQASRKSKAEAARARTARYRKRMREKGLRPVQIWVPDTTRPGFAEEIRRQVVGLRGTPGEEEAMEFLERIHDVSDWK